MARRKLTKQLRTQVLVRDGYRCRMCGRTSDEVKLQVDHVRPVSAGGTDTLDNLAALCRDCNLGKSDLILGDYTLGDLLPDNIECFFHPRQDDRRGSYIRYHLYCYCKTENRAAAPVHTFHREWRISDSEFAVSSNREGLEARKRREETTEFVKQIRRELAVDRCRLTETEEGLVRFPIGAPGEGSPAAPGQGPHVSIADSEFTTEVERADRAVGLDIDAPTVMSNVKATLKVKDVGEAAGVRVRGGLSAVLTSCPACGGRVPVAYTGSAPSEIPCPHCGRSVRLRS